LETIKALFGAQGELCANIKILDLVQAGLDQYGRKD
jgi:hypothetical protein